MPVLLSCRIGIVCYCHTKTNNKTKNTNKLTLLTIKNIYYEKKTLFSRANGSGTAD